MKQVKIFTASLSGRKVLESQINDFLTEHPDEVEDILWGACGGDEQRALCAMVIYTVPKAE